MHEQAESIGTFDSNGLKLGFRRWGVPGKFPILLLHGIIYFSYDWKQVAGELAIDREVVALDQRGFGMSDWSGEKQYSVHDFAADAARLIEHLGWKECIVVGHSMGGKVAAVLGLTNPELACGLVLVDAPPLNAPHGARRIGDQLAGVPAMFSSIDEALRHFPATPWKDKFHPARRARFEAFLKPVSGRFQLRRDPWFHQRFFEIKERWPYHFYERDTWPVCQEADLWETWKLLNIPTEIVAARAGDFFAPEAIDRAEDLARENPLLRVCSYYVHHNIPGRDRHLIIEHVRHLTDKLSNDGAPQGAQDLRQAIK